MTLRALCAALSMTGLLGVAAVPLMGRSAPAPSPGGPERLPATLAGTGLFDADRPGVVDARHRPFVPQYPLWSDGMTKRRWVFLPPGTPVDASQGHPWDFPAGTRFWKEFSLNGRRIETRILWKTAAAGWLFGSYVWNDEGTGATLAPEDGIPAFVEVAPGRRYSIPSRTDCQACHGTAGVGPLGFNELQLSPDRDPNAIHGEPLAPRSLTLRELIDERLIVPARADPAVNPPRIRASSPSTRAVLGYLAANCGACHDGSAGVSVLGPSLTVRDLLADGDAVARSLIGRPSKWQVPGQPGADSVLVHAGSPELSTLLLRMRSRSPSSQMPPLGTVLRDEQAVAAIAAWIATESPQLR